MLVLSSPSGAGKTSIAKHLLQNDTELALSVSVTTRARRSNEVNGHDYHFIDKAEFDRLVRTGALLEHAEVFGNHYGTPRDGVERALAAGRDILFDIDWQGANQLLKQSRADAVCIFILPPSVGELERRLRTRAQDSAEVVQRRMDRAHDEIEHWKDYDYVIRNLDLDECVADVRTILAAERMRRTRQPGLAEFVAGLQATKVTR